MTTALLFMTFTLGVAAAHKTLEQRGCHFVAVPNEITPGTWAATFTDPDGHLLTVLGAR